ncbi:MAG: M23 family metallopeptidase [Mycobacterium leprae]
MIGTVLAPPHPVLGADDRRHLAFEMQVVNLARKPLTVQRIDTLDAGTGAVLASRDRADVAAALNRFGGGAFGATLAAGGAGVAILDVALPPRARLPRSIVQRITTTYTTAPYRTGAASVASDPAVVVRPPLRGARWVDLNGCCATATSHRSGTEPINGALHVPERFAIDFVRLDGSGRLFTGPANKLTSYRYFGTEVLSVADGVVVGIQDGLPENVPGHLPPVVTPQNAGGNYVVVDIGDRHFAFYAHLQPGSLRVTTGARVRRGQVLGLLGNTGNSDAPHLHFHVMDRPSPLASNGLPFRFESFDSLGTVTNPGDLFAGKPVRVGGGLSGTHARQLPLNQQVVNF